MIKLSIVLLEKNLKNLVKLFFHKKKFNQKFTFFTKLFEKIYIYLSRYSYKNTSKVSKNAFKPVLNIHVGQKWVLTLKQ